MESFANSDINEIMKIEGNNKCIDCLAENPTFASINNAVFLCENCANIHKRLGTNISIIKSLTKIEQLVLKKVLNQKLLLMLINRLEVDLEKKLLVRKKLKRILIKIKLIIIN